MRPVVVEDQANVRVSRHLRVDSLQEAEELLTPMPAMTLADDLARGDIERREQRRRPVPAVVVRPALRRTEGQGQNRRGAVEAWIWLFSSTLSTDARSGGSR